MHLASISGALVLMVGLLASPTPLAAQTDTLAGKSADAIYQIARQTAFSGKYDDAISLCRYILHRQESHTDARILLGRILSWKQDYEASKSELRRALRDAPLSLEAMSALADTELWSGNTDEALSAVERALRYSPNDAELIVKKARILIARHDVVQAGEALNRLTRLQPKHPEISRLKQALGEAFGNISETADAQMKLGVMYTGDGFSRYFVAMHQGTTSFSFPTSYGVVTPKLTVGHRFGTTALQAEVESYPLIDEKSYGYVQYAYAGSTIFATHRAGLEYYRALLEGLEASVGIRGLLFRAGTDVAIVTFSANYYTGDFLVTLRPFVSFAGSATSLSVTTNARWYLWGTDEFLSLRAGVGQSPDERLTQVPGQVAERNIFQLHSQSVEAGIEKYVLPDVRLLCYLGMTRQEVGFLKGEYIANTTLSVGFQYGL